jgi:CheY-like chemotaxis protein
VVIAGRKSRELVHQLLTFSQPGDHVRHPLSLHSLLKESLKLLRPTIPSWIELRERITPTARPISAEAAHMHGMILRLVEHALHDMRRTGGVLEIGLHDETLPVERHTAGGLLPAGCYVCLTVRDTGEGLPRDMTSPVFDPSFKTLPSTEARPGLSVVHEIVMAHGGTLLVDSGPGLGTTVSVYLPALSPPALPSFRQDEPLPHGHECILFVDDDEALARFGGEMLESLGYYPVVRLNAAEAWKAFQIAPQRFDLLITDRAMPGMTGEMLTRECQRLRPDLPVILCTGSDPAVSTEHATTNGITEYVLKPLTLQDLAHTIRRVLDTRPVEPPAEDTQSTSTWLIEERDALSTRR